MHDIKIRYPFTNSVWNGNDEEMIKALQFLINHNYTNEEIEQIISKNKLENYYN